MKLTDEHFHHHLTQRMQQRGITRREIEETLNTGVLSSGAKPGTRGKMKIFTFESEWEGNYYKQKQVIVYYKMRGDNIIILTAIARYGEGFQGGKS